MIHISIKKRVEFLREKLALEPMAPTFGDIHPGNPSARSGHSGIDALLAIADGAWFDSIVFFSIAAIPGHQYRLEYIDGDPSNWIVAAQLIYDPILVARDSNRLVIVGYDEKLSEFGTLEDLFSACLYAESYAAIDPDNVSDDWYEFLTKYPAEKHPDTPTSGQSE